MLSSSGLKPITFADVDTTVVDLLPAAVVICEAPTGRIVRYNRRATELWGREPQLDDPGERFDGTHRLFINGHAISHEQSPMAEVIRTGVPARQREVGIERPDGSRITVMVNIDPLLDSAGRVTGAVNVFEDVTERKRADELQAAERRVLQEIAAGAALSVVLDSLARLVERHSGPGMLASILLLEPDGQRLMPVAGPSLPPAWTRLISPLAVGPAAGSCGTSVFRKRPVIVTDIASDPLWADYRDAALGFGLRACWSTPIIGASGTLLGTFAVYYREPRGPRPEERRLVEFVTGTAAIAIERERGEEERERLLEREQAARADAETASDRVSRILESITDGFLAVDGEFRLTYLNATAERLLGQNRTAVLGKRIWELYPDLAGTYAEQAYRRAMTEREPEHLELFYPPLGAWLEANLYPADGSGLAVYFRDVTERKRDEEQLHRGAEALRNQQHWLEAVLDLLPTPMLFLEPGTGRITFANRAADEFAGGEFPTGNLSDGKRAAHLATDAQGREIPPGEMPGVRLARGERLQGFEMNWHTPDGERSLIIYGDTMPDMHGHPATAVFMFQDISQLKQTEEALRQAAKLESLGVLAGGVAHDFNNLLVGIMGNASLVLEDLPETFPDRHLVENIVRASERAADLTQQMLAYSGQGRFIVQHVDLSGQVREIGSLIQTSIPKSVELKLELRPDLPHVFADASQMQQVIMNLVINGAEAIGEGRKGTVRVRTAAEQVDEQFARDAFPSGRIAPGRYVVLEVSDTGCGMDESVRARIFDPFFTTKFTGRGLGLAAVLGIVRGHSGAITVDTSPGAGTTIRVLFPAAAVSPRAVEQAAAKRLSGAGLILVVDDEEVVRETARSALERYGYSVLVAGNGREAIDVFRGAAAELALVLLDMTMPVMSGEEALKELQSIRPGVKVIVSSGYSEQEATRRFSSKGIAGFMQKPYSAAALAEKIAAVLSCDGSRPQPTL